MLLLLASTLSASRPARAEDPLARDVNGLTFDQFIQKTLDDYGVPGAVVVVVSDKGTEFLKGYGVRRRGETALVDGDTRFQIASMSKFIAATAVGALVDRGVVSWDAPVTTFSPDTVLAEPYATQNVTLRDFFAHRTGLPAYTDDLLPQLEFSFDELLHRARFQPFDHSFRSRWAYSNYGIFLGQYSAARAAGMSPPQVLSSTMLEPLGMTRSGPVQAELFKDDNRATAHNIDGTVMPYENVDKFSGAGAIVSTGHDIARWMTMLLAQGTFEGKPVLSKDTVTEIFAASMVQGPGGPLNDPNDSAGLGCESYHFLRWRVIEKNGALNGMRTIVTLVPERDIGIAIFANKQMTVFPEAVRAEFLERVLAPSGRDLQKQIHEEQKGWFALLDVPKPPPDAKPLSRDLDAFAGPFVSPLYGSLTVVRNGESLAVKVGAHDYPGQLTHWSADSFLITFENPDVPPGLLTFAFKEGNPRATGFDGSRVPNVYTTSYGHFDRAQ
ncbi:hypothetical protein A6V36_08970 [Paraburkholderia ginsengiterrae]|uniref:Uncharacterized protein n=2 Tax=Paraburkholderia ginsengiterrae TaxID=1462993 RepID=A0A1A9N780_9BURK|nr:hypothetical protein A6V36_08970 [Paraburkholderia ginsengiterrae]OAJ61137.1 hypothetical protein A6V37_03305 [Paraburkholderia ginsengiterrae]